LLPGFPGPVLWLVGHLATGQNEGATRVASNQP
jgi:hypothetical protein